MPPNENGWFAERHMFLVVLFCFECTRQWTTIRVMIKPNSAHKVGP